MDTFEMLTAVREGLLEFDINPISDAMIMRRINFSYTYIYSHIARSDDSRLGMKVPFNIVMGQTEYDLPREAWNKRVEQLVCPYPPTVKASALGFHAITRVDFKEAHKFNVPRVKTYMPEVFSQLRNKIFIYPTPITPMEADLLITPHIPPLGITSGQIISIGASDITLDTQNTTLLTDRLSPLINAFLSVVDFQTGEVKYVFSYNAVSAAHKITLVAPARVKYMGQALTNPATTGVMADIAIDDYVVPGFAGAVNLFSDEFDQFMINQAVLMIRSNLNEQDPETLNALKANMEQLKSDTAGRPMGIHVKRSFGRGASYTRPGRGT